MDAEKKPLMLPGKGCRHWTGDRCLYEERLNPGLHERFRCIVLKRWERALDAHMSRAERFGLTEEEAGEIWRQRMAAAAGQRWECPDFRPVDAGPDPVCTRLADDLCLLRLPPCPGRCRRYKR